ncbi:MAG: diguanylate cyclase [Gammaproteobacteria bacterium]
MSDTLTRLNKEKSELESFIANVTRQLGEISGVIAQDYDAHLSDQEDTQSLQILVKEGMTLLHNEVHSSEDLGQMKLAINNNIDVIKGGVDEFVNRIRERHEATEERNERLCEQLSKMEEETQELQVKLIENREKLLHDTLTGVHSRLAYDEQILKELARAQRYSSEFCYAIIDIDFFKRINDDFGHNAGDKALKIVAQIMLRCSRKSDYVCRIGGEEFVFILPNTDIGQASTVIEKLRSAISDTNIHFKKQRVVLTVSAGITENRNDDTADSIYERADAALYFAKNSGRNCQHVSD